MTSPTPKPAASVSNGRVAFAVVAGAAAVAGGVAVGLTWSPWLGASMALMGLAAIAEPFAVRTGLRPLRLAHWALYAGAIAVFLAGLYAGGSRGTLVVIVVAFFAPAAVAAIPLAGVTPVYLAARRRGLGLSFRDVVASPLRWGAGVGAVKAFDRLRKAGAGISFAEVGAAGAAGADLGRLAEAVDGRVRSGRPAAFHELSAASVAGHDPVALVSSDDVVGALVAAESSRRAA